MPLYGNKPAPAPIPPTLLERARARVGDVLAFDGRRWRPRARVDNVRATTGSGAVGDFSEGVVSCTISSDTEVSTTNRAASADEVRTTLLVLIASGGPYTVTFPSMTVGGIQPVRLADGRACLVRLVSTGPDESDTIAEVTWDAPVLALLAAVPTATGFYARTGATTGAARTLTAPAAGLTITNPAGVAGNPTFALANDLAALEALAGTGFAVRTAADTWGQRDLGASGTFTTTDGKTVTVADGLVTAITGP